MKTKIMSLVLSITAPDGTLLYRLEDGAEVDLGQKFIEDLCFGEAALASLTV